MSWLFGRFKAPAAPVPPPSPPAPERSFHEDMTERVRALVASTRRSGGQLPVQASIQLFAMLDHLTELLDHTVVAPPTVEEQIAIEFMLKDYIPSTVNAYLASRAAPEVKDAQLVAQLQLLLDRAHAMAEAVYAHDSAQLEINGRFLREKFG
ncbi:hypothetical protein [Sanguibacter suarezii]|uniref:hypothetical protein n=1 Tax=Sanguibacter suarezii TaxID=60921 RepID=UPI00082D1A00|nr:hypothetical protein [Sanguibacter suarezii]